MASFQNRRQDRSLRAIIPSVLVLHLVLILLLIQDAPPKKPIPKTQLIVKTVQLAPKNEVKEKKEPLVIAAADEVKKPLQEEVLPKPKEEKKPEAVAPVAAKAEEKKPDPKEKEPPKKQEKPVKSTPPPPQPKKAPPPKKEAAKPKSEKKPEKPVAKVEPKKKPDQATAKEVIRNEAPKSARATAKDPPKKDEEQEKQRRKMEAETKRKLELLARAKEKIGKIDTSRDKLAEDSTTEFIAKAAPSRIDSMQIDSLMIETDKALNAKETAYRDELAARLKLLLKLPEYGEVKVKICVLCDGTMKSVQIVSAKNRANREYLEKALPKIKVPAFGDNFKGLTEYTFQITMSNE